MSRTAMFVCAVTIFVSLPAQSAEVASPAEFTFRLGGSRTASQDPKPSAAFATAMDYKFYRTYSVGLNFSYARQVKMLQKETSNGYEDVLLYLADESLWKNSYSGLVLSGKVGFISPVSQASRSASRMYGLLQSLNLKKTFSDRFNVSYLLAVTEYGYEYDTVDPEATDYKDVSNNVLKITNRAKLSYDIFKGVHWDVAAWVHTFRNTLDQNTEVRGVGTMFTFDFTKTNSIDLGVSSAYKSAGPDVWDGPLYSNRPFESDGIQYSFGTTLKI